MHITCTGNKEKDGAHNLILAAENMKSKEGAHNLKISHNLNNVLEGKQVHITCRYGKIHGYCTAGVLLLYSLQIQNPGIIKIDVVKNIKKSLTAVPA